MSTRETRIFIPATSPFAAEDPWPNILGYVIRPLTRLPGLESFWFSRYVEILSDPDLKECDPLNFPPHYYHHEIPASGEAPVSVLCSVRLRYALPQEKVVSFEKAAKAYLHKMEVRPQYWKNYPLLADLGGPRFTEIESKRRTRAKIVWALSHSASQLMLHALEGPDARGDYQLEPRAARVPHHLVSNITGRPG